jgi:hypothetical protein
LQSSFLFPFPLIFFVFVLAWFVCFRGCLIHNLVLKLARFDGGGGAAAGFVLGKIFRFGFRVGVWGAIFLLNSEVQLAELEG